MYKHLSLYRCCGLQSWKGGGYQCTVHCTHTFLYSCWSQLTFVKGRGTSMYIVHTLFSIVVGHSLQSWKGGGHQCTNTSLSLSLYSSCCSLQSWKGREHQCTNIAQSLLQFKVVKGRGTSMYKPFSLFSCSSLQSWKGEGHQCTNTSLTIVVAAYSRAKGRGTSMYKHFSLYTSWSLQA
jgi:hypothetical protein